MESTPPTSPPLRLRPRRTRLPTVPARAQDLQRREPSPGAGARPRRFSLELLGVAYHRLTTDNGDGLAAGLAFGALLSIAPLLLVVLAAASLVLDEGEARAQLVGLVRDSLGWRAVPMLDGWIDDAQLWSTGATVLGVVLFLFGSARFVGLVESAFQIVFDAPPRPPESFARSVRRFFGSQLRSLLVTLAAGLLILASIVLRALGGWIIDEDSWPPLLAAWPVLQELLSFAVWVLALVLVYRVLPPVRLHRADVLEGALVSAGLVSLALLLLRTLATHLDFGAAYGAAGAVIGTLITLYAVSQLFLFGAELTAELSARRGTPLPDTPRGVPARDPRPTAPS